MSERPRLRVLLQAVAMYWWTRVFTNAQLGWGHTLDEYGGVNGGPPFGKALDLWRERAPGFNLDHITAPLRLEAIVWVPCSRSGSLTPASYSSTSRQSWP